LGGEQLGQLADVIGAGLEQGLSDAVGFGLLVGGEYGSGGALGHRTAPAGRDL
jgi:hypothetical protein